MTEPLGNACVCSDDVIAYSHRRSGRVLIRLQFGACRQIVTSPPTFPTAPPPAQAQSAWASPACLADTHTYGDTLNDEPNDPLSHSRRDAENLRHAQRRKRVAPFPRLRISLRLSEWVSTLKENSTSAPIHNRSEAFFWNCIESWCC